MTTKTDIDLSFLQRLGVDGDPLPGTSTGREFFGAHVPSEADAPGVLRSATPVDGSLIAAVPETTR